MTQAMILGAAAFMAAASTVGTIILFRQGRRKQKHSPTMTFKELYEDNAFEICI